MGNVSADTGYNIAVVFEDDDVVVIDKPSGIKVHADGHDKRATVADWFIEYCPSAKGVGEPMILQSGAVVDRPGIVHRLDGETSGVMILAKDHHAFVHLKAQFHDRHAKKEYRAFVYGRMTEQSGTIDRKIGRSAKDFILRSAQRGAKGTLRDAVTEWEVIAENNEYSYLTVVPQTGRTHQIRVHLKAVHHPIICDSLYAPKQEPALGFTRLALHAHRLTITLPSGAEKTFEAPIPETFTKAVAQLRT